MIRLPNKSCLSKICNDQTRRNSSSC